MYYFFKSKVKFFLFLIIFPICPSVPITNSKHTSRCRQRHRDHCNHHNGDIEGSQLGQRQWESKWNCNNDDDAKPPRGIRKPTTTQHCEPAVAATKTCQTSTNSPSLRSRYHKPGLFLKSTTKPAHIDMNIENVVKLQILHIIDL